MYVHVHSCGHIALGCIVFVRSGLLGVLCSAVEEAEVRSYIIRYHVVD
jgi:hypothetical protein